MQRWDFGPQDSMMVPKDDGRFYLVCDVAGLKNALRAYCGHKEECACLFPEEKWDCDCGFSALMGSVTK